MYSAQNLTPEQVTEAYQRMATRPADESGTPRKAEPADMTLPQMRAELVKSGYAITSLETQVEVLTTKLEAARKEITELAAKLQAASGVTASSREHETLVKIQRSDVIQRNTIWNLEATVSAQRRTMESLQVEVKSLRKACAMTRQAGIPEHIVHEPEQKTPARLRQAGDVLPETAA